MELLLVACLYSVFGPPPNSELVNGKTSAKVKLTQRKATSDIHYFGRGSPDSTDGYGKLIMPFHIVATMTSQAIAHLNARGEVESGGDQRMRQSMQRPTVN